MRGKFFKWSKVHTYRLKSGRQQIILLPLDGVRIEIHDEKGRYIKTIIISPSGDIKETDHA